MEERQLIFTISEKMDKKFYKKNPEMLPENQDLIAKFRTKMAGEYLNQFRQPLESKKEKELLEQFLKEATNELYYYDIQNSINHISVFVDIFLGFLDKAAKLIPHKDIVKMLWEKQKEIEAWFLKTKRWYEIQKYREIKEVPVNEKQFINYFQSFYECRSKIIQNYEDKRIWQFLEKNQQIIDSLNQPAIPTNTNVMSSQPPIIGSFTPEFIEQHSTPQNGNNIDSITFSLDESNEPEETDEISSKTVGLAQRYFKELIPTITNIEGHRTSRNQENQTMRIGKNQESTIVNEFWEYYQQFSVSKLPNSLKYLGDQDAEMKISLLIDLFQDFYLESVYPSTSNFPIVHYRFIHNGTKMAVPGKIYLVADTHGSMKDTIPLIRKFTDEIKLAQKENNEIKIIFIGDFIDRNPLDIHNLLFIMTFNLKFPNNVLLLRGNHEEMTINANYGFGNNVLKLFSKILFASFNNLFKDLPLMAILHCEQGKIGVLHGGIPLLVPENGNPNEFDVPDLKTWEFHNRHINIEELDTVTAQLLWNDPLDDFEGAEEKFYPNNRGMGYRFGKEVFNAFCLKNNIDLVFRGHQVFQDGICRFFDDRFISFFSAHEYGKSKIKAKYIEINTNDMFNFKVHNIQTN